MIDLVTHPALMALLSNTFTAAGILVALYAIFEAFRVAVAGYEDLATVATFRFIRKLVGG